MPIESVRESAALARRLFVYKVRGKKGKESKRGGV